ncbi:MAG: Nin1 binding protein [Vezdaea aestivalis]|nr:MAG: Nin1 binding protein [Vezdaea aestivalis]
MENQQTLSAVVLDTGPLLKNEPSISSLQRQFKTIFTLPSVLEEVRDAASKSRIETTILPFLQLREPVSASIKVVAEFARKTGDFEVLSKTDIHVLALAYELECEINGGDWRLRKTPGQKGLNVTPPLLGVASLNNRAKGPEKDVVNEQAQVEEESASPSQTRISGSEAQSSRSETASTPQDRIEAAAEGLQNIQLETSSKDERSTALDDLERSHPVAQKAEGQDETDLNRTGNDPELDSDSSSEGWITPSNIKRHRQKEADSTASTSSSHHIKVATITTDFAMQNVLLQMNLNLLSTSLMRIRHVKSYILRCHACFLQTHEMSKQFCPRCGKPTLMRTSCSVSANGEFKIHLKKNMQWSSKGNRYSVPKPTSGSASGRHRKGGGQGGWGHDLILVGDQKEYVRAIETEERRKDKDLMDRDYLPSILTGERTSGSSRPKIGAGRNVNSRKRRA